MIKFKDVLFSNTRNIDSIKETENFEIYKLNVLFDFSNPNISANALMQAVESIESYAKELSFQFTITIEADHQDSIHIGSASGTNEKWLEEVCELNASELIVDIEIFKKEHSSLKFVFSVDSLCKYLTELSLSELIDVFKFIPESNGVQLLHWENLPPMRTHGMSIQQYESRVDSFDFTSKANRSRLVDQRNSISNTLVRTPFEVLPSDFLIQDPETSPDHQLSSFVRILNLLSKALIICFISDISSIKDGKLDFKIKGFKAIQETLDITELERVDHKTLRKMYIWLIAGGSIVDKVGLIRNILSVHIDKSITEISDSVYSSISHGYDLYLKDNVKQYIEVRNKISDFIFKQTDKASELTKSLHNGWKSSLWTLITFFITVVFLRTLVRVTESGQPLFSSEIYLIANALIIISILYLLLSVYEVSHGKSVIIKRLSEIENRYKDLVAPEDLKKISDTTQLKSEIKVELSKKTRAYALFWTSTLVVFFIVSTVLRFCF